LKENEGEQRLSWGDCKSLGKLARKTSIKFLYQEGLRWLIVGKGIVSKAGSGMEGHTSRT